MLCVVCFRTRSCIHDTGILTVAKSDHEGVTVGTPGMPSVPRQSLGPSLTAALPLQVVGYAFDQVEDHLQTPYYETVYSLLDTLSPAYRDAFGNALLQRLEALQRDGQS